MWGRHAESLRPGMLVSVYGHNLEPAVGCGELPPVPLKGPYPHERCGVRVLIAGRPAGLLAVRPTRIDLQIPEDVPASGEAPIEVIVSGTRSAAVAVPFGEPLVKLSLAAPAYAGLPVWLKIQRPYPYEIYYPYSFNPWNFGGAELQMTRDGAPLVPIRPAAQPEAVNGLLNGTLAPAGSPRSRLPLHLAFQMDKPGRYAVRFVGYRWREDANDLRRDEVDRSDWFEFTVLPCDAARHERWLRDELARIPDATPGELAGDILPSLLASPGERVLAAIRQAEYHPDPVVRGFAERSLGALGEARLHNPKPSADRGQ